MIISTRTVDGNVTPQPNGINTKRKKARKVKPVMVRYTTAQYEAYRQTKGLMKGNKAHGSKVKIYTPEEIAEYVKNLNK